MLLLGTMSGQTRINLIRIIAAIVSIGHHGYNPQRRRRCDLLTDFCPGDPADQVQTFLARIAELPYRDGTSADPHALPRPKMTGY